VDKGVRGHDEPERRTTHRGGVIPTRKLDDATCAPIVIADWAIATGLDPVVGPAIHVSGCWDRQKTYW
jgi:hypothetical protein